jgi:hypothetical protein
MHSFKSPPCTHHLVVGGGNAARADAFLTCITVQAAANELLCFVTHFFIRKHLCRLVNFALLSRALQCLATFSFT